MLTAGHCTGETGESPATNVYVSFDTELPPDPLAPGITPAERAARAANYITGTAHPDPGWDGKLSISKQHDQGVVVLDAPATSKWPGITPAPLLPVGTLDGNQGALKNETFTLVGYGVDIGDEEGADRHPERRSTTSYLKNVQDEVVTFQINDQDSKAGGGSCFGDSGGPAFLGPVRARRRVVRQLAVVQRDRQLPARRHGIFAGLPGSIPLTRSPASSPLRGSCARSPDAVLAG